MKQMKRLWYLFVGLISILTMGIYACSQSDFLKYKLDDKQMEEEDCDLNLKQWNLVWNEEFEGTDELQVDKRWDFENGKSPGLACSRWRGNAKLSGEGTIRLYTKHENHPDAPAQEYTAASMRTKESFQYGYFECRYRYAGATGTNNSFWIMQSPNSKKFEIDINEGRYPNEINTNVHDWTATPHWASSWTMRYAPLKSAYSCSLATPVEARRIRFRAYSYSFFHIREVRVYEHNGEKGYPVNMETTVAQEEVELGLTNKAKKAKIITSGTHPNYQGREKFINDGNPQTTWATANTNGEKWIELEFEEKINIGCVQILNGYYMDNSYSKLIDNFKLEYWNGTDWVEFYVMDERVTAGNPGDLSQEYHTYGLEWNENELIYYFDRNIIRRTSNKCCKGEALIWLSVAIMEAAGLMVPEEIDGKCMEVDYVRVYEPKP